MILRILLACWVFFSACEVIKAKKETATEATEVAKRDSGSVSLNSSTDLRKSDWFKETVYFQPKDCTINNYYNTTTPTVIIREGGSNSQQTNHLNYDSIWQSRLDSLQVSQNKSEKTKETVVLNPWQIAGIAAGVCLVILLLSKLKVSFRK